MVLDGSLDLVANAAGAPGTERQPGGRAGRCQRGLGGGVRGHARPVRRGPGVSPGSRRASPCDRRRRRLRCRHHPPMPRLNLSPASTGRCRPRAGCRPDALARRAGARARPPSGGGIPLASPPRRPSTRRPTSRSSAPTRSPRPPPTWTPPSSPSRRRTRSSVILHRAQPRDVRRLARGRPRPRPGSRNATLAAPALMVNGLFRI